MASSCHVQKMLLILRPPQPLLPLLQRVPRVRGGADIDVPLCLGYPPSYSLLEEQLWAEAGILTVV